MGFIVHLNQLELICLFPHFDGREFLIRKPDAKKLPLPAAGVLPGERLKYADTDCSTLNSGRIIQRGVIVLIESACAQTNQYCHCHK